MDFEAGDRLGSFRDVGRDRFREPEAGRDFHQNNFTPKCQIISYEAPINNSSNKHKLAPKT